MKRNADPRTERSNTGDPVTSTKECIFSASKHSYVLGLFVVGWFWGSFFSLVWFFYNIGWLFESFREDGLDAENK